MKEKGFGMAKGRFDNLAPSPCSFLKVASAFV